MFKLMTECTQELYAVFYDISAGDPKKELFAEKIVLFAYDDEKGFVGISTDEERLYTVEETPNFVGYSTKDEDLNIADYRLGIRAFMQKIDGIK